MATPVKRRKVISAVLLAVFVTLLIVSMYLLGYATENLLTTATEDKSIFDELYIWVLIVNAGGIVILAVLIGVNVMRLVHQHRANTPGSRLTLRMIIMFVVLSIVPVSIVYYFSLQFLQNGIDAWFNVKLEKPLENAIKLSKQSLELRQREALVTANNMKDKLEDVPNSSAAENLNDLRTDSGAHSAALFGKGNRIIAFSSADAAEVVPTSPSEEVLLQVRTGSPFVGLVPSRDGLFVRAVLLLPQGAETEQRVLQVSFLVRKRLDQLASGVQSSYADYRKRAIQREPLKNSFSLALSLVLMLSLFAAVWAAFATARRLMAPVRELAQGTQAVAEGDYSRQLPVTGHHELSFLVSSFNDMTRRISQASNEATASRQLVEEQRAYLEAVLGNLSSGVITIDREQVLRTGNTAASQILRIDLEPLYGQPFEQLAVADSRLGRLLEAISPHISSGRNNWREEVILFGKSGRQVLVCHGAILPGTDSDQVIVIDDITTLVQAQRDAAWGEVARRLAHEIKNPLTPIQLSAERLRHKYLGKMSEEDAGLLDRSTNTIVQQVEAMKEMVNAFAEYARAPQVKMEPLSLNDVILSATELYKSSDSGVQIHETLDMKMPIVEGDAARLRQLMLNLIKNGLEAMEDTEERRIDISTRCMEEAGCQFVELVVRDYGPGFSEEGGAEFFEPYVTTKPKGTGLGLAIVKKIVEEHGGMIWAENTVAGDGTGARFIIRMPVMSATMNGDSKP